MSCGCTSACGCTVLGDGSTTSVVRDGDTFIVTALQFIDKVASTDCIQLAVSGTTLSAYPILDTDNECVELSCGPDGLRADLVIDDASTAAVSCSEDGLRVDIPPSPPLPDSAQPGDYLFFAGIGSRTGYIDADGSDVDRGVYQTLWDALSLFGSTAVRTLGSPIIDFITDTRFMRPGMPVEATGFAPGTTILSVNSPTQITVTSNATSSGADTEVRAYPYGDGDGNTTFNVPDLNRSFPLGIDNLSIVGETVGDQGGLEDVTLSTSEIPAHDHNVSASDSGHTHAGSTSSDGTHSHTPSTGGRVFVTVDGTPTQVAFANDAPDDLTGVFSSGDLDQLNNASTSTTPDHFHTFTTDPGNANIGVTEDSVGGGDPHENMPPYTVGRWMVKT